MKKFNLLFILPLLFAFSAQAQTKDNVARECVLFEVFTGVRCPYCPAAANGIGQMLEEGLAIAPVAYHTNAFSTADYYTAETNARASYYGINSYPTLKVDGTLTVSGGGDASSSMYSTYLNRYNQRINVTSPFTIDLSFEAAEGGLCRVNCTVNKVGDCSGSNVRVFIALTQCNIDVAWQGMQGLHHVCRDMIPTQTGTPFTGTSMTVSETFEMNYPKEDCYLTAWVQDYTTKEVYQAVRMATVLDVDYDLVLKSVDEAITQSCSGAQHPRLVVKNLGKQTVTSFVMNASNGQETVSQNWNGSLAPGETATVLMEDFVLAGDALEFSVSMPNGQPDGFMPDNVKNIALTEVPTIDGYIKIQAKSGKNFENESIVITDMNTGEIFETITFEQASHSYTFELVLPNASCYCIAAKDSEGEGWGNGFFQVKDSNNNVICNGGGASAGFDYERAAEVYCDGELNVNELVAGNMDIYPNPSKGVFTLEIGEGNWQVAVYDVTGRCVLQNQMESEGTIDLSANEKGVYFVKATDGQREYTKKIVVL